MSNVSGRAIASSSAAAGTFGMRKNAAGKAQISRMNLKKEH
jgi:hypothetical protein